MNEIEVKSNNLEADTQNNAEIKEEISIPNKPRIQAIHPNLKDTEEELKKEQLLPDISWSRKLSNEFKNIRDFQVGWKEGAKLAMLGWRMWKYVRRERAAGRVPIMDPFGTPIVEPLMGVPIGGIGGGSIGRGWRGDFIRWNIAPCGVTQCNVVEVDQFSVFIKRKITHNDPITSFPNSPMNSPRSSPSLRRFTPRTNRKNHANSDINHSPKSNKSNNNNSTFSMATVLHPSRPKKNTKLASEWNWEVTGEWSTYHGLFPRAWTVYEEPDPTIRLICKQVSPVIPHNYKESSYPSGVFVWTIENTGTVQAEVSLMFTFQNGMGTANDNNGGHTNQPFQRQIGEMQVNGVTMSHKMQQSTLQDGKIVMCEDPVSFGIAAMADPQYCNISWCSKFSVNNANSLKQLWTQFKTDGTVKEIEDWTVPAEKGKPIAAAVAVKVVVGAGGKQEIVFGIGWDNPIARFSSGATYFRRYTSFFGEKGDAVEDIVCNALENYPDWEKQIEDWQNPILKDPSLPEFYKAALFNELYYIVDGGTIWTSNSKTKLESEEVITDKHVHEETQEELASEIDDIGHFAYLESLEYLMYNTYDVHFYASFALIMLWPKLELSLQRDVGLATMKQYAEKWEIMHTGKFAMRKVKGAVPHDMGNPGEDPWNKVNSYCIQDISRWKDLPCKFVLQVYRDYFFTNDLKFLKTLWPVVKQTIEYAKQFDLDGDGVIDNENFPDQTYDTWAAEGCSAYSGGLWLASLAAAVSIAEILGDRSTAREYTIILEQGKQSYNTKLWNGKYYDYDASNSLHHDSIMTDQLAGQWYAKACGLSSIVPDCNAYLALRTVYEMNVKGFKDGKLGAINGIRPDGKLDDSCMQSLEVWTGTTFAAAAAMLQQGLVKEAFETIQGIIVPTYQELGYMYQTPEAWDVKGQYRSAAYMRPLVIWAIQWAWERFCSGNKEFEEKVSHSLLRVSINDPLDVVLQMPLNTTVEQEQEQEQEQQFSQH